MKAFVALFVVALADQSIAAVLVPRDTPEVAAAKAAHFAQYNYEAVRNTLGYVPYPHYYQLSSQEPLVYNVPVAYGPAPIGADGRVLDTPEVIAAKVAHFAAHAKASLKPYGALAISPYYAYGYPYTAPIGPDGNVVDTPEVAAAKAAHFAAHAAAHY
ncbi:PREDICTED: cuticle protein 18.7-like [Ceratosolen solmsi marchali]|uniref:Cuticle protein 18.7-like n=1 Tax=Ceratosolen solmsi marchali TaxID=326594 RepID=A0AAJ6YD54_9HYME|nr:PREDICTED: cuticle protein 18.7-like [Ceratosolen solmsi marchali]